MTMQFRLHSAVFSPSLFIATVSKSKRHQKISPFPHQEAKNRKITWLSAFMPIYVLHTRDRRRRRKIPTIKIPLTLSMRSVAATSFTQSAQLLIVPRLFRNVRCVY
jgi:hypothetical protein